MTRRQKRKQLEQELHDGIVATEVWQVRPYTAVKVTVEHGGQHEATGFAKAHWPDGWDAGYGVQLATSKAVAALAKRLVAV